MYELFSRKKTPAQNKPPLKRFRDHKRWSTKDFAEITGITNVSNLNSRISVPSFGTIEALMETHNWPYDGGTAVIFPDKSHNYPVAEPQMTSGIGQCHTYEADPQKPKKKLTPYLAIGRTGICVMVDNPPSVSKTQGQWLISSTLPCRTFKEQEEKGLFWVLWADFDKNPPPLPELAVIVESILGGADFELYNTRSATEANQKARLLIPLETALSGKDYVMVQEILNDKFEVLGVIPDRANQGAGQLCYLPNKGELYSSVSKRGGKYV